jgi:hypothetical protein
VGTTYSGWIFIDIGAALWLTFQPPLNPPLWALIAFFPALLLAVAIRFMLAVGDRSFGFLDDAPDGYRRSVLA